LSPTPEAVKEDAKHGLAQGNFLTIEEEPNIEVSIKGLSFSARVTVTHAVNAIPYVVQAGPGLLSQKDLPFFAPVE